MTDASEATEYFRRQTLVGRAFSPAAPVTSRDLFAGRRDQMARLIEVVNQRGQHGVIYGDRGVGKTSLARVSAALMENAATIAYYTCSSDDRFDTIWARILDEIPVAVSRPTAGFGAVPRDVIATAKSLVDHTSSPDAVRRALYLLSESRPTLLFIDEFDRVRDDATKRLFADTIKILSDQGVDATLVLVGVGDTIDDLIREHASVQRSLVQVHMPRMTRDELAQIVNAGMESAELTVQPTFVAEVSQLSQGMPHFTHLLGQQGAYASVAAGRTHVMAADITPAIASAVERVSQTQRQTYHNATYSNRETLYKEVLLACALADKDDLGYFGAPAVRDQLQRHTGQRYDIPAFAAHLKDFSSTGARGGVLQKTGSRARFRYRFLDPLLPPYVVMRSRADGLVSPV